MRATLRDEVAGFLRERGPSTASTIALGVRARRADVDAVLAGDGFSRVTRPEGASPRPAYFGVSRLVPVSRAALLLGVLADGGWHSREAILDAAGRSFLTNNAASELRRLGHVVWFGRGGYRLVERASSEAPSVRDLIDSSPT